MSFLDVGTGTGNLAIAAAKIDDGNSKISAFDTDADSISIARENAAINGVADKIDFFHSTIDQETPKCDFVAANLTVDVIVPMLSLLLKKSEKWLLMSGILAEQQQQVFEQLERNHIESAEIEQSGEWISVVVKV